VGALSNDANVEIEFKNATDHFISDVLRTCHQVGFRTSQLPKDVLSVPSIGFVNSPVIGPKDIQRSLSRRKVDARFGSGTSVVAALCMRQ
jgi:hypothetical protein